MPSIVLVGPGSLQDLDPLLEERPVEDEGLQLATLT